MLPEFREAEPVLPQNKVLVYENAMAKICESRERGLRVILAQGIFDIVHMGHIEYFREARRAGDLLFVGIENDNSVRMNKGEKRPFNNLDDRLDLLSELETVDYVFGFNNEPIYSDSKAFDMYIGRYKDLNPNFIAVSSWDPNLDLKRRQAEEAGVGIVLINHGRSNSSTRLLEFIGYE